MSMTVPDTVKEVTEEAEEEGEESSTEGGGGLSDFLSFRRNSSSSSTESERNLSEVNRRVNDQYRFEVLTRVAESEETEQRITDLKKSNDAEKANPGDLVRVSGACGTDPLYPLLSALQYFVEATSETPESDGFFAQLMKNTSQIGQVEQFYELLYHGWVGLEVDTSIAHGKHVVGESEHSSNNVFESFLTGFT